MLAASTPPPGFQYKFPVLASAKLDGVRAIVRNGVLVSRALKPIPNKHCQALFGRPELNGLDGELVVGAPFGQDVMQRSTSGVMRIEGEPAVTFWVFDDVTLPENFFKSRLLDAHSRVLNAPQAALVPHAWINTQVELDSYEELCLAQGYEGAMVRDPLGFYKNGRSTAKEGGLVKLKRFSQDEARVVGSEERMHNGNVAEVDNLGHTKRSTHQENKTGRGDLGALVCETPEGVRFNIGTGFSDAERLVLWESRDALVGKLVSYKHFAAAGVKDAPRFPVFVSFRHQDDL
jgi:DNA ligase-1